MFEEMTDRIAGTLLMGLDVAVEFATLGEYRIVEAEAAARPFDHDDFIGTAPALPLVRRPERRAGLEITPSLLPKPATAVGRASAPPVAPAKPAKRQLPQGARQLPQGGTRAVLPKVPRRRPGSAPKPAHTPASRKRGGAVGSASQLCLFGRE